MSKATKYIFIILFLLLVSIWAAVVRAPDKNLRFDFFNVGQGDAILIQTPEHQKILIDGGPDNLILEELGKALPFYDRKIDAVFLTHPHADHLFGLLEVFKRYQVGKVYLTGVIHTTNEYLEFLKLIKEKNLPAEDLQAGDDLEYGEVKIRVLWPAEDLNGKMIDNLNNSSLVLSVEYKDFAALLLGDLEEEGQGDMLRAGELLKHYNLIKIAHHGSSDGFDPELIDAVKPETAVISVGADNKYGHPALSTISALESRSIKILRTDRDGTISISQD